MLKRNPIPSQKVLHELFSYDAERGCLIWQKAIDVPDKTGRLQKMQAAKLVGRPALNCDNGRGYRYGQIFGVRYSAHRVIWKYHHGTEPSYLDHINGKRGDNRIENLRAACGSINARNRALRSSNTSGFVGVSKVKNRWKACYDVHGKSFYLGLYGTPEEAAAARAAALRGTGLFTERHGTPSKETPNDKTA